MGLYTELGNSQYCCFQGTSPDNTVGMLAHSGVFGDYLEQRIAVSLAARSHYKSK